MASLQAILRCSFLWLHSKSYSRSHHILKKGACFNYPITARTSLNNLLLSCSLCDTVESTKLFIEVFVSQHIHEDQPEDLKHEHKINIDLDGTVTCKKTSKKEKDRKGVAELEGY